MPHASPLGTYSLPLSSLRHRSSLTTGFLTTLTPLTLLTLLLAVFAVFAVLMARLCLENGLASQSCPKRRTGRCLTLFRRLTFAEPSLFLTVICAMLSVRAFAFCSLTLAALASLVSIDRDPEPLGLPGRTG